LNPKGLGLKDFAGWMFFDVVIKISKIKKMDLSSYFDVSEKLILGRSPTFTTPSEKTLFMKTCSLGSPLRDEIFFSKKKICFSASETPKYI
jgi:hypothetical protein